MTGLLETTRDFPRIAPLTLGEPLDVTFHSALFTLPMRTRGLPDFVLEWLIDAGISTRPLNRSAIRKGVAAGRMQRTVVLYDSRDASARLDAETADSLGHVTIDAARLLAGPNGSEAEGGSRNSVDTRRWRFLNGLRVAVEDARGTWVRLADVPHPYRAAVCVAEHEGDGRRELADNSTAARAIDAFAKWPLSDRRPDSGRGDARPSRAAVPEAGGGRSFGVAEDQEKSRHPLMWRTTLPEFTRWWRWRRSLSLTVRRDGAAMDLSLSAPSRRSAANRWRPAIEIWRGRHCAVVPLSIGSSTVDDSTIPFQARDYRDHAGILAFASDSAMGDPAEIPLTTAS